MAKIKINSEGGRPIGVNHTGKPSTIKVDGISGGEAPPDPDPPVDPTETESPYNITTSNQRVVRSGGTPGVDCDYTSITAALADITNANVGNQYTLQVKNGTYNEQGIYSGAFGFYVGITLKHYIHIVGESKSGVIINGPEAPASGSETLVDTFHIPASCLIKNVTIQAYNSKYCIHADYNGGDYVYNLWLEDCNLNHQGSRSGYKYEFGFGLWKNQQIHIRRCTTTLGGLFIHGISSTNRDVTKPWYLSVKNSNLQEFYFIDYIEYAGQTITLDSNEIDEAILNAITSVYDANPGNPACNQGFKIFTEFINTDNTVGSITQNSEATSIIGGTMEF